MSRIANCDLGYFDSNGDLVKNSNRPLVSNLSYSSRFYIRESSDNPNSSGNPTIRSYIEREAEDGNVVVFISQSLIITSPHTNVANNQSVLTFQDYDLTFNGLEVSF